MAKSKTLFEQLQDDGEQRTIIPSWRSSVLIKTLVIITTILITGLFYPGTISLVIQSELTLNSLKGLPWQNETVRAEYAFPLIKPKSQYEREVRIARESALQVFNRLNRVTDRMNIQQLNDENITVFLSQLPESPQLFRTMNMIRIEILTKGFLSARKSNIPTSEILISQTQVEYLEVQKDALFDSSDVQRLVVSELKGITDETSQAIALQAILASTQPNIIYSPTLTELSKSNAVDNVPKTNGLVHAGEIVVRKGEFVNDAVILRMQSYGMVGTDKISDVTTNSQIDGIIERETTPSFLVILGSILHAGLVYSILILFISFLRKEIFSDNANLIGLSVMIVATACLSWLSVRISNTYYIEYLVLIPAFSMLTTIYFDSRTGFNNTVAMSLMIAGIRGNDYSVAFAMLIAGTLAAYSVRDIQSRTQLFRSIAFIYTGFIAVVLTFGLERSAPVSIIIQQLVTSLVTAVLSPVITYGVIALVERFFNAPTDLQLSDFDNLNHPLLVELNEKAPGTYQHTLQIAHLVEAAAFSIGANPLLARVGAYFHDIGKIAKPEYFIENQIDMDNKHDLLTPKKSATLIRNHVLGGIELAMEYKLPKKIVDFIPMHHGTTLIKHFYAKAVQDAGDNDDVDQSLYRYPGPKPNSKETALVMLADSVEAISRTVEERDDLDSVIATIFQDKIEDGQLDECDLTISDLQHIRESFVKNLIGVQHQRIQYSEVPQRSSDK